MHWDGVALGSSAWVGVHAAKQSQWQIWVGRTGGMAYGTWFSFCLFKLFLLFLSI